MLYIKIKINKTKNTTDVNSKAIPDRLYYYSFLIKKKIHLDEVATQK